MKEQKPLFRDSRRCVSCLREATPIKRKVGEPNVMAVNLAITRKPVRGKSAQRAAGSVRICEDCLVKARVRSWPLGVSKEGSALLSAVLERLSGCYSGLVSEESKDDAAAAPVAGSSLLWAE